MDLTTRSRQLTDKLTARQQAILEFIRVNQPVTNKQISLQFGCAPSTTTVHLMFISRSNQIWRTGDKAKARWHADKPFSSPKTPPPVAPPAIEQVSSIWHYAQRCARHAAVA